ncbi:MAG: LytTR family DNA-binding domain-containing protein [Cytophagales bacterium]
MKKNKIKALVVDDELMGRESLSMLIKEFCSPIDQVHLASNIDEAVLLIEQQQPNIVFLDINMPNETGFDLFEKTDCQNLEVIFTTAYSEYAISAIKHQALDYLLKPIDVKELIASVNRAVEKIDNKQYEKNLFNLFQQINQDKKEDAKIALPMSDSIEIVKCAEILYCEASGNYTIFHLKNGKKHVVSKSLKEYENALPNNMFFRIHHSLIINIDEIIRYTRGDGGYVTLASGQELMVSKRRKDEFLKFIGVKSVN